MEALAEEDQKLYAEVVYSWLISRIDQMTQAHELSYVFGVVTEEPYDRQLLLFISAEPGSSLFLYTDGLAEAVDPDNEMFGTERILESLNAEPNRSPEELLRGMKEAVDGFVCGLEPFDDLTMIGFTYHGPPRDASCAHEGQDPGPEGI